MSTTFSAVSNNQNTKKDATIKMGRLAGFERIFTRHRMIIMKGGHHFPQMYDPEGVATAIRSFWDEVIAPGIAQ